MAKDEFKKSQQINNEKQIQDLTEKIKLNPEDFDALVKRGILYRKIDDFDKALKDFNQAIALNPNCSEAYNSRGLLYRIQKKYDEALSDFNRAIALNPKFSGAYHNRGLLYRIQKKYDEALSDFNQAIALNPKIPGAYNNRGILYRIQGKYDEALSDFNQAIALNSKFSGAYHNRGLLYRIQKKDDEALSDFNQAIALNPKDLDAHINRGILYREKNDFDRALEDFDQVIKLKPKDSSAYNFRGMLYGYRKDYPESIADFKQAIDLNSENFSAFHNLGVTYEKQAEYTKAISSLFKAIELNPKFSNAYQELGVVYGKQGEYIKAISSLIKAIELNPKLSGAYQKLGVIYGNQKEHTKALSDCIKNIKLNETNIKYFSKFGLFEILNEISMENFTSFFEYYVGDRNPVIKGKIKNFFNKNENNINLNGFYSSLVKFSLYVDEEIFGMKQSESISLYQYTKIDTLKNYMNIDLSSTKKEDEKKFVLRLYNTVDLNDPNEGYYLINELKAKIKGICGKNSENRTYDIFKEIESYFDIEETNLFSHAFSASLTDASKKDFIPMWGIYGDFGKGVVLKVNVKTDSQNSFAEENKTEDFIEEDGELISNGNKPKMNEEYFNTISPALYKIKYNAKGQEGCSKLIENMVEKLIEIIKVLEDIEEKYVKETELKELTLRYIFSELDRIRFLIKSDDYQHENEYRVLQSLNTYEDTKHDEGSTRLYTEFKNVTLKKVTFGPKVDAPWSWGPLLQKIFNDEEIKVGISKAPWR